MVTTAKKVGRRYTMGSRRWPDGEYWELIDGEAYDMTPAQSIRHQTILGILHHRLMEFFAGKSCSPFLAPTDVVFDESNIVQPDILVVCDKNKITAASIQSAPDLIVEILFLSTPLKDKREKRPCMSGLASGNTLLSISLMIRWSGFILNQAAMAARI